MGAINRLTPTEEYVLKLITHGYESKDIAKILRIKERTVQVTYIYALHSKLYTRNRVQLALYALRNGLVRLEDVTLVPTGDAA
jgi:DNA-binding NarL/FixJ family response regulator